MSDVSSGSLQCQQLEKKRMCMMKGSEGGREVEGQEGGREREREGERGRERHMGAHT